MNIVQILVSSFGGVGSKCLVKGLLQTDDETTLGQAHTHMRQPPSRKALDGRDMIYMFGDPFDAVLSFFNRRTKRTLAHGFKSREGGGDNSWVVKHCRNIGGDYQAMNADWDLSAYLDNGVDLLGMEEHFDNWTNARTDYPILFVRYETMWDHVRDIYQFVGLHKEDVSKFPPQQSRGSRWENEPEAVKAKLGKMYGPLREKITRAANIRVGGGR